MQRLSFSIGIPIYNEEKNIGPLLRSIKLQNNADDLHAIYLYNDASTDGTTEVITDLVKQDTWFKQKIHLTNATKNCGKSAGLNSIFSHTDEEVVVLVDSDIQLHEPDVLEKMLAPFSKSRVGLTNGWYRYPTKLGITARVMDFSAHVVKQIGTYKPLYWCCGGILAIRKPIYKHVIPVTTPSRIDAYLYMKTLQHGFSYSFVDDVEVPLDLEENSHMNLNWFIRIQRRSRQYPDEFVKAFPKELQDQEIPLTLREMIIPLFRAYVKNPVDGTLYIGYKAIACCVNSFARNAPAPSGQISGWRKRERK